MEYRDEFNIINKAQNERLRQQDLDDLNNELRGVDVGRISRFLSPDARKIVNGERKDKKGLDPLELVLLSAEYMQAFEAADHGIRDAQQTGDKVRAKLDEAIEQLRQEIDETLNKAVTLPDGRKAFMNKDGEVFTDNGERVDQAIVDGIDWAGRPSLEEREDQLRRMDKLQELSREEQKLSLRLGELHNELHDDDKPSTDRVEEIDRESKEIGERYEEMDSTIDKLVRNAPDQPSINQPEMEAFTNVAIPDFTK